METHTMTKSASRVHFLGAEYRILWVVGLLLGFGMIMTVNLAYHSNTDPLDKTYFIAIAKFFLSLIFGLGLICILRNLSSRAIFFSAQIILLLTLGLLLYTSQHGVIVQGARRWIDIFGFRFQPVELFKPVMAICLASVLSLKDLGFKSWFLMKVLPFIFAIATIASLVLIFMQPNHSTIVICLMAIFIISLLSKSVNARYIYGLMLVVMIAAAMMFLGSEEKSDRIKAWIFGKTSDDISLKAERYQVDLALKAIASGGWTGKGLGRSVIKYSLPAASTDFVYAIIIEEFGFIGGAILMLCYLYLILEALSVSARESDQFLKLAGVGVSLFLILNVIVHVAVNLDLAPTTGIPLPFISQGGSALIFHLASIGIILNLAHRQDQLIK